MGAAALRPSPPLLILSAMKRFALAVLSLAGAVYFGAESVRMDGYLLSNGTCSVHSQNWPEPPASHVYRCAFNTFPWQFLLAVALGGAGLGLGLAVVRRIDWRNVLARRLEPGLRAFVLRAAVRSARQLVAVLIAALAIAGVGYLGSRPLDRSPVACTSQAVISIRQCWRWTRADWQIPAAVLLGLAGMGSALVVAGHRRPRLLPYGVSEDRLAPF